MIVYDKNTNEIIRQIPDDQDALTFFYHYPQEFKDSLATINVDNFPRDLFNYKVENEKLVKRSEIEIIEIQKYGRVLTEEERVDILLMPTQQEIQKAENTIEILSLLQEVQVI